MILGPGDDRLAFEHELMTLHRRETLALDVEACPVTSDSELMDRLRLLEGTSSRG
jgi:hypothetical protein